MTTGLAIVAAAACIAVLLAEASDWARGAKVGPLWVLLASAGLAVAVVALW